MCVRFFFCSKLNLVMIWELLLNCVYYENYIIFVIFAVASYSLIIFYVCGSMFLKKYMHILQTDEIVREKWKYSVCLDKIKCEDVYQPTDLGPNNVLAPQNDVVNI